MAEKSLLRGARTSLRLSPDEREVIVTYNDAEKVWRIYSDSATMRGKIARLARSLGAEVRRVGDHGIEFEASGATLRLAAKRKHGGRAANLRTPALAGTSEGKLPLLDGSPEGGR